MSAWVRNRNFCLIHNTLNFSGKIFDIGKKVLLTVSAIDKEYKANNGCSRYPTSKLHQREDYVLPNCNKIISNGNNIISCNVSAPNSNTTKTVLFAPLCD